MVLKTLQKLTIAYYDDSLCDLVNQVIEGCRGTLETLIIDKAEEERDG